MTRGAKVVLGIIIVAIIAAIIAVAATHKSSYSGNNSNSKPAATNQSANTPAVNNSIILTKTSPTLGQYLTDPSGKPLYTYPADTTNTSNCTGSCLTNWPPYIATATTSLPSGITMFKRTDTGTMQYAYNGMPLYYFTSDTAGQAPTGNGVDNFSIAKPPATSSSTQQNTQPSTNNNSNGYPY